MPLHTPLNTFPCGSMCTPLAPSNDNLQFWVASDSTVSEALQGAFGQIPLRFFNAYDNIKPMVLYALQSKKFPSQADWLKAVGNLASITSTWNNFYKGLFMQRQNMLIDTKGAAITNPGEIELSLGTEVAQMLGFAPSEIGRIFEMESMIKQNKEHRANMTNSIVQVMWDFTREVKTANNETERAEIINKYADMQAILLQTLPTYRDKSLVITAVESRMTDGSKRSKVIKAYLEEFNNGQIANLETLRSQSQARALLQTGVLK